MVSFLVKILKNFWFFLSKKIKNYSENKKKQNILKTENKSDELTENIKDKTTETYKEKK